MNADQSLRDHLIHLLGGGNAHLPLHDAIAGYPFDHAGAKVDGAPYTAWQLLEHLRIAQWDILEFSRDPHHVSPDFPDGYWPGTEAPPARAAWEASASRIRADLDAMIQLVADPATDLHAPLAHGDGQTILREALVLADHNAYHLGQLVLLRRMLDARCIRADG